MTPRATAVAAGCTSDSASLRCAAPGPGRWRVAAGAPRLCVRCPPLPPGCRADVGAGLPQTRPVTRLGSPHGVVVTRPPRPGVACLLTACHLCSARGRHAGCPLPLGGCFARSRRHEATHNRPCSGPPQLGAGHHENVHLSGCQATPPPSTGGAPSSGAVPGAAVASFAHGHSPWSPQAPPTWKSQHKTEHGSGKAVVGRGTSPVPAHGGSSPPPDRGLHIVYGIWRFSLEGDVPTTPASRGF